MLTFKRTTLTINGEATTGYSVEGLDKCFRGLQVAVVKDGNRWHAHEATIGADLTPRNWAGGLSNKTRAGIIQIVAIHLSNVPQSMWDSVQEQLDYDLEKVASGTTNATELRLAQKGAKALLSLLTRLDLPEGLTDTIELRQTQIGAIKALGRQIASHTDTLNFS